MDARRTALVLPPQPASEHLRNDRLRTHGAQRTVYERARQYVERVNDKTAFIDKDRFLVRQESHTGFMHLYLYSLRRAFSDR